MVLPCSLGGGGEEAYVLLDAGTQIESVGAEPRPKLPGQPLPVTTEGYQEKQSKGLRQSQKKIQLT